MKKILYTLFILLCLNKLYAQSSIMLPNGTVIASFTQATRPASPVIGQLIYQTDGTAGLYIWSGTAWTAVSTGSGGGTGTVTNVTANVPLSVTNSSTTPTISISQANGTTNGFLSSTDWNTFNNKQNPLSEANATTSGILTSTDWNTFNNKQNPLSEANATTSGILTSTDWNTFNNKQNPLSEANATTSGILTSTDWNAFNSKFSLPTLTSGSLLFSDGSTISQNNTQLYWNNESQHLGIGTNSPVSRLHISGADWDSSLRISSVSGVGAGIFLNGNKRNWAIIGTNTGAGVGNQKLGFYDATSQAYRMVIDSTGNLGLGEPNPAAKLDVNGLGGIKVTTTNNGAGTVDWVAGNFGATTGDRVVIGLNNGRATIGAHSHALNSWASLGINVGGGNVGIGTHVPASALHIKSNSGSILSLEGATQSYMQFYPNSYESGRKGWLGFGSNNSEMSIVNEKEEGDLILKPGNNGKIGVGTDTPDNSALVDVSSTTKGFLPPRMTFAQRNAIVNPAEGLMVYQADSSAGIYVFLKGAWSQLVYTLIPSMILRSDTIKYSGNTINYTIPRGINKIWITLKGAKSGTGQSLYYQDPSGYDSQAGEYLTPYADNFVGQYADIIKGSIPLNSADTLLIVKLGQASENVSEVTNSANGRTYTGGWPDGGNGTLTFVPYSDYRSYTYSCGLWGGILQTCTGSATYTYNHKHGSSGGGGGSSIALNSASNVIMGAKGGNGVGNSAFGLGGGITTSSNLLQNVVISPNVTDIISDGYAVISYYVSNAILEENIVSRNRTNTSTPTNTAALRKTSETNVIPSTNIYSFPVNVPSATISTNTMLTYGTTEIEWKHNLGYQPIIMISKEQANSTSLMEYVSTSYYHVDSNMLRIRCSNVSANQAEGTLRVWIMN